MRQESEFLSVRALPLDGHDVFFVLSSEEVAFHDGQALYFIVEIQCLRPWDGLPFASLNETFNPL